MQKRRLLLATIGGRASLGNGKRNWVDRGRKKGDIALVDLDGFHQTPCYNIYSTLIYATSASDVQTVIINGDVVMENRTLLTLDEAHQKGSAPFPKFGERKPKEVILGEVGAARREKGCRRAQKRLLG